MRNRLPLPEDYACVRIDRGDGIVRLAVSGEVDLATTGELDQTLSAAQAERGRSHSTCARCSSSAPAVWRC